MLGEYCTSPLVLNFSGHTLSSVHSGAAFDFEGDGTRTGAAWIRPGDALLALDRDGDGRITSGIELFGNGTPAASRFMPDGFTALAQYDDDSDGAITPNDAIYPKLMLWYDNGDALTQAGELRPLSESGVMRILLGARSSSEVDAAGSRLALWSSFELADGRTGDVCDIFFAVRNDEAHPQHAR